MKRRKTKIAFLFCLPIVAFFTLAVFLVSSLVSGYVSAISGNGGGIFIKSGSQIELNDGTTVSGNTSGSNGGGVYNYGGSLVMNGEKVEDYIYFGSYPKTLEPDTSLISSTQDSNGYYIGKDGISRFAKIESANPCDSSYVFNNGAQISSGSSYYFKVEPIKWKILEVKNGKALLLCEDIIDVHQFFNYSSERTINDSTIYASNYKYSDIRAWLNGYSQEEGNTNGENWSSNGFLQKAFTETEQSVILTTTVNNKASTTENSSNTYVCENTNDKVFLLSYQDMINPNYGFDSSSTNYDTARMKQTTDYARANHAWYDTSTDYLYNGYYWLRSPSTDISHAVSRVDHYGCSGYYYGVNSYDLGVVPALYVSESKLFNTSISGNKAVNGGGIYNYSGDVVMNGGAIYGNTASTGKGHNVYNKSNFTMNGGTIGSAVDMEYEYVRIDENGNEDPLGKYVLFGSWPQLLKESNVTIDENWVDEDGYYIGSDLERYVKKSSSYYKVEPIKWRILKEENGEAFLLCENALTHVKYSEYSTNKTLSDGSEITPNNYEYSYVREWLNGYWRCKADGFLPTAFTSEEQKVILETEVDNSLGYANNTFDKVFLLSIQEVLNSEYGFSSSTKADENRMKMLVDSASSSSAYSTWCLRSAGSLNSDNSTTYDGTLVYCVTKNGEINAYDARITSQWYNSFGIVPALRISLASTKVSEDVEYGIYNDTGAMKILGGTVYDNIYNNLGLQIDSSAKVYSTIRLAGSGFVNYSQNGDAYPYFKILVDDSHDLYDSSSSDVLNGLILRVTYTDSIDLSKFIIDYDDSKFSLVVTNENNQLDVRLETKKTVYFTSNWKTTFQNYEDYAEIQKISFQDRVISNEYSLLYSTDTINCYTANYATGINVIFTSDYNIEIAGPGVFKDLDNVEEINFNGVKYCTGQSSVDDFGNATNGTSMAWMFCDCYNLQKIDLSDWDVSFVKNMKYMFSGCSTLESLDLSKWDNSKVEDMRFMFENCYALKKLFIGNFESHETDVETAYMFKGCSSLEMLDLSGFEHISHTYLLGFYSEDLKVFKTPYNCDVDFTFTSGLINSQGEEVTQILTTDKHSQTLVSEDLLGVSWFSDSITISGTIDEELQSAGYDYDVNELTNIRFEFLTPSGYHQVGETTCGAFLWVSNKDPYDVALVSEKLIKPASCVGFFMNLTKLKRIILTNFSTSGCDMTRQMFWNCSSLEAINVGGLDTSSVTDMRAMFYGCASLKKLYLTNFDVSNLSVSHSGSRNTLFTNCSKLQILDLSSFDLSSSSVALSIPKLASLQTFRTPYGNASAISLTSVGVTLYDEEGNTVTSIPANLTESMTLSKVKPTTTTETAFVSDGGNITSNIVSNLKTSEWRNNLSIGIQRQEKELFFEDKKKWQIEIDEDDDLNEE